MRTTLIAPLTLSLIAAGGLALACSSTDSANDDEDGTGGSSATGGAQGAGDPEGTGGDQNPGGGTSGEGTGGMGGSGANPGSGGESFGGMGGTGTGGDDGTGGSNEPAQEICGDSRDNDGDMSIDCDDSDCAADPSCVLGCLPPAPYTQLSASSAGIPSEGQVLWLRADVGVGTEADQKVCVWEDQSGNTHHLEQPTSASRPVADATLGAQDAIDFGTALSLFRDDVLGIESTSGRTFIVVAQAESLTERAHFVSQGRPGDVGLFMGIDINSFNTSGQKFGAYLTNNSYDADLATDLAPHVHEVVADSLTVGASVLDNFHYFVDGQAVPLTRNPGGLGNTTIEDFTRANQTFVGKGDVQVAELIIYDHALTAQERASIVSYLSTRYGL